MKIFNTKNNKELVDDTKYNYVISGTPSKWKEFRKSMWSAMTDIPEDDETTARGKFAAGCKPVMIGLAILAEIAITPIGIVLWIVNNLKNSLATDKRNHDEGCKSNQSWPWMVMVGCLVFAAIMLIDYKHDGLLNEAVQYSLVQTVDQLNGANINNNDKTDGGSTVRFREFSNGGGGQHKENVDNVVTNEVTTTATEEVITEESSEEEVAVTEPSIPVEEFYAETQPLYEEQVCVTRMIAEDGQEWRFDENGEIIWDEEDWNTIPEECIPVERSVSFDE